LSSYLIDDRAEASYRFSATIVKQFPGGEHDTIMTSAALHAELIGEGLNLCTWRKEVKQERLMR